MRFRSLLLEIAIRVEARCAHPHAHASPSSTAYSSEPTVLINNVLPSLRNFAARAPMARPPAPPLPPVASGSGSARHPTLAEIQNTTSSSSSSSSSSWLRSSLLVLPPVLAAFLGNWQLDRRAWKTDLLERRQRILTSTPCDILADDAPQSLEEYQRVHCTGQYDDAKTQYIGPRPRTVMGATTAGYLAVTPLRDPETHRAVMVLRGWVPATWRERNAPGGEKSEPAAAMQETTTQQQQQRSFSMPSFLRKSSKGEKKGAVDNVGVTVHGIVRGGEDERSSFVPENDPQAGLWFYIDPVALAKAMDLPEKTPLIESIDFEGTEATDHLDAQPSASMETQASSATQPEEQRRHTYSDGVAHQPPSAMEVLAGRGMLPPGNSSQDDSEYPITKTVKELMHFNVMPRDHANYAATWFTLSGATALLAVRALKRGRR